jgi:two-component system, cell cycle sensor histidine kinase and response regulator CckA
MVHSPLLKKFSLVLLLALVAFGVVVGEITSSAMRNEQIARMVALHFLQREITPLLQRNGLDGAKPHPGGRMASLTEEIAALDLGAEVKIHGVQIRSGQEGDPVPYSAQGVPENLLAAVFHDSAAEWAQRLGIRTSNGHAMPLEVSVRGATAGEQHLLLDLDIQGERVVADIDRRNRHLWLFLLSGCLLLYFFLYGLYRGAALRIERQNREIQISEERFRNLIHAAEEGIVALDRNGRILLMNGAAAKMFGCGDPSCGPVSFADLFHLTSNPLLRNHLDRFVAGEDCGSGRIFQAQGRRENGETFSLEVSLAVSGEKENRILTGIMRDVTERNRLQAQVAEAQQQWEETFNTINDAITIHDQDFNIIRANRAAAEMLNQPLDSLVGQKCFRTYHGQEAPPLHCPSCDTLRTNRPSTTEVYESHLDKHIEVKALPRFDEDNNLTGLVHVVRDITARKKAEEKQQKLQSQLNHIQKMESVGRLAGGIAHDFNNILTVIIGYTELMQKELPEGSGLLQDIAVIREAGEKASLLTGQLLAFSRKQVLKMKPVDLNRVVEDLARMLRRVIGEDIIFDLHLASKLGPVIADAGQLEQVLLNLAVNARDAMPDGGHFILETLVVDIDREYIDHHAEAHLGPHVLLAVTDTGTGISPQVREHIFEPFFTTKEVGKGTGLGLATVYGIIKQHGGQIYVYSEPGKGTTFKIYLPTAPHAEVVPPSPRAQSLPRGSETILVVEDDAHIRSMFRLWLESLGYEVLLAADGREALAVSGAYAGCIDLLLTDVIMPNMNGQQLADALCGSRPDMPVLFMSGYTDDVIIHHGVLGPGGNFIQKPLALSALAQKLRAVLNKS